MKEQGNMKHFLNRELSWLEFNVRVLEEAQDTKNPLFERLKFAAIAASNMDEFYMVRVASLKDQVHAGFTKSDPSGLTPEEQLERISQRAHEIVSDLYNCYNRFLLMELKRAHVHFLNRKNSNEQERFLERYYWETIYPTLTPLVVDPSRSFPLILNKSLNIALLLENPDKAKDPIFATVQVPSVLGRLIELPSTQEGRTFMFLEEIIKMYIETIFCGHNILTMGVYRITRNADMGLDEEDDEDLLHTIEQSIQRRKWSALIRLEIESGMDEQLLQVLKEEMEVPERGIFEIPGPLDLTFLMKTSSLKGFDHLRYPPIHGQLPPALLHEDENIFAAIRKKDILLHHPYESFEPVVELVRRAAVDPQVLAIKQTLYRVSGNSPIVAALAQAAQNGKQVTVLVELKARFDEENNIIWARQLEQAGCQVIYGLVGLKTHCKTLLIVRREEDGIKRYVHLGTGNYNDVTARIYTDLGLFTVNPYIGADISALFNMLSGYSRINKLFKVDFAPIGLLDKFLSLIQQETSHARKGRKARIIAKMNSLVDEKIITALYEASQAGVEIDLIIRGICCLRPGVPGLSERIRVRSIVGRFLEHTRVFYFYNDASPLVYLSSADWMPRNLYRRVELLFPVEDEDLQDEVQEILDISLRDTVKARVLNPDGTYSRVDRRGKALLNSQEYFYEAAMRKVKAMEREEAIEEFRPIRSF